ncbi:glutathione S-transferase [Vibrio ruber]|uniref:glutathione transferase n=1 Tax=Vibrio ruber (strain DSM 16370 / JCM 11486 / BCRC 17186 / CECT 7878 / LMG 23124 / VR1) TaxID=1123498 RepID=A0A1R4LM27_VIBR1|nr:glutathione S-transferase [Vibrio ruber]WNJ96426.1 glutathione S-transferase [Vibrio ruber]SJN57427.1 glutathionine S-transferase [Vibrio ruber DSM 16370]
MIYVHYLEQSRALRVVWLLEALTLEYEIIHYDRDPQTWGAPDSLKAIHPLGKSPTIIDGEHTIAESGAIIEYLIDTYDHQRRFRPESGQALLDYRYWLHAAEGSFMMWLVMRLIFIKSREKLPFLLRPLIGAFLSKMDRIVIEPRVSTFLRYIDDTLGSRTWFTGEQLSGADFQMNLVLQLADMRADLSGYPNIQRYMNQVSQLASYQQALQKIPG